MQDPDNQNAADGESAPESERPAAEKSKIEAEEPLGPRQSLSFP